MSGFPAAFVHPAFEVASFRIPFEVAIAVIGLGLLPFLLGFMFRRNRFITILCLVFAAIGVVLSLRYGFLVSVHGSAHGLVDSEGTFRNLPRTLALQGPTFALGFLAELFLRRRSERKRVLDGTSEPKQ